MSDTGRPSFNFALLNNEVHVWQVPTDAAEARLPAHLKILSVPEQDRAGKFKFAEHRRRYIVAHAALRRILASYLNRHPARLEFREGPQGKPDLVSTADQAALTFNLSHSHEAALVAVTRDRPIGIDIEYMKTGFPWQGIVAHFFAAGEIARLNALPPDVQLKAFFACWTRKESYIKAKGGGLSIALDGFEVSVDPDQPAALLRCVNDPNEVQRWSLANVDAGTDYAAALTVAGSLGWVRLQRWDGNTELAE